MRNKQGCDYICKIEVFYVWFFSCDVIFYACKSQYFERNFSEIHVSMMALYITSEIDMLFHIYTLGIRVHTYMLRTRSFVNNERMSNVYGVCILCSAWLFCLFITWFIKVAAATWGVCLRQGHLKVKHGDFRNSFCRAAVCIYKTSFYFVKVAIGVSNTWQLIRSWSCKQELREFKPRVHQKCLFNFPFEQRLQMI